MAGSYHHQRRSWECDSISLETFAGRAVIEIHKTQKRTQTNLVNPIRNGDNSNGRDRLIPDKLAPIASFPPFLFDGLSLMEGELKWVSEAAAKEQSFSEKTIAVLAEYR